MALGREREHVRAARLDLDHVAHRLVEKRRIGAQRNDERTVLDE